ncbi:hypothetical protein GOBAR_AA28921 [Gossypium barbadense]|uniref:Uncharacterized protein n=1 Tax=Gossypium barbadense TaxID=3634 RepID=A0A2P5WKZ2_GOSBA|nr:hypothetical protein GOBAR_AA28921 [Gossypium barbadense]
MGKEYYDCGFGRLGWGAMDISSAVASTGGVLRDWTGYWLMGLVNLLALVQCCRQNYGQLIMVSELPKRRELVPFLWCKTLKAYVLVIGKFRLGMCLGKRIKLQMFADGVVGLQRFTKPPITVQAGMEDDVAGGVGHRLA